MRRSCSGIATAGLIGALLLSACTSERSEPPTEATATESTPVDEPTVDGTDQASWRDEYTASELAAYEAALQRWTEYEVRSEPIWATGKANAEAEALFRQYFPAPNWQAQLEKLQTYEEAQVRVTGLPSVQWSRAARIKIGGTTGSVSITQCVDYLTAELVPIRQADREGASVPAARLAHHRAWAASGSALADL